MSLWSTAAITLAIAIVALYSVLAVPLFPDQRATNNSSRITGIFLYLLSSILVSYETRIHIKLKELCLYFHQLFLRIVQKCYIRGNYNADVRRPPFAFFCEHNLLAYFFFIGYTLSQIWNIANDVYFAVDLPECFNGLSLVANVTKLILATVLILTIIVKTENPPAPNSKASIFIWAFVGAVCFSSAFKYVVDEVTWGYIDIVEKSILDPDYGLNITNGTTVEEYVPKIFKFQAHCIEHVIFPEMVEYILELIPFSTEYFSLATFFCVVAWKNVGNREEHHGPLAIARADPEKHTCTTSCLFSIRKWVAILIALTLVCGTCVSIVYFYRIMKTHQYKSGIWLFIVQQLLYQVILVTTEVTFYFGHMRGMDSTPDPPHHFQLDAMMLIFPLFPLGILFVLRVFPDLTQIQDIDGNDLTSPPLWTAVNIFLALFNYLQVTFQAIFISEVFCRLSYGSLRRAAYFFLVLASVNFCVWLSWTLECKLITIHGRSFKIFGVVEWIIIVYATVPFVMFCFAHSTACFLEIMTSCFLADRDHDNPMAGINLDADEHVEENPVEDAAEGHVLINDGLLA